MFRATAISMVNTFKTEKNSTMVRYLYQLTTIITLSSLGGGEILFDNVIAMVMSNRAMLSM